MHQLEVDHNLDKWLDKWQFILRNDKELSKAAADIALTQLDDIMQYGFNQSRKDFPSEQQKVNEDLQELSNSECSSKGVSAHNLANKNAVFRIMCVKPMEKFGQYNGTVK